MSEMKQTVLAAGFVALAITASCAHRSSTSAPPSEVNAADSEYVYVQVTPKVVEHFAPEYPEGFCKTSRRAKVRVMAFVLKDGTVSEARVDQSVPLLDEAAIACVKRWRFEPARSARGPIQVWTSVDVHWDCGKRH